MPDNEKKVPADEKMTDPTVSAAGETPADEEKTEEKEGKSDRKKNKKAEARAAELEKKLAESEKALKDRDDKYLRLAAEYDNYRRRTQKEKESIYSDAYGEALKQLLPVIDNLELAAKQTGADAEAVRAGVEMTLKLAVENMAKLGISAFGEVGEEFDPNKHTAVFHVEDENLGENVIAEVLQRGYIRGDRIIRFAVVKVAN